MHPSRRERILFRVVITGYRQGKSLPYTETPTRWKHITSDDADDAINALINEELKRLNGSAEEPPFHRKGDEIHVTDLGLRDRLVARYTIHPIEQGFCFDKNNKQKPYWEYRDYRIYPNEKNNRYKITLDGQYVATRHNLNKCLDTIDLSLLMAQINNGDI